MKGDVEERWRGQTGSEMKRIERKRERDNERREGDNREVERDSNEERCE